jgi:hypothetical protein
MFLMVNSFNAKIKKQAAGLENSVVTTRVVCIVGEYQRRTPTGVGRVHKKTVHRGAAKNPRWLKACNTTRCDMCEFFFISIEDEIVVNAIAAQS